jgi:hypothetical protein
MGRNYSLSEPFEKEYNLVMTCYQDLAHLSFRKSSLHKEKVSSGNRVIVLKNSSQPESAVITIQLHVRAQCTKQKNRRKCVRSTLT